MDENFNLTTSTYFPTLGINIKTITFPSGLTRYFINDQEVDFVEIVNSESGAYSVTFAYRPMTHVLSTVT